MIAETTTAEVAPEWRRQLRGAVSSVGELLALLGLDADEVGASDEAARDFPLRVPRGYVDRMRRADPRDPLLRQVLPSTAELASPDDFSPHPLAEREASPVPGLIHKYRRRVLLVTTGACAIHCRYCFRRHFPYTEQTGWSDGWQGALEYIAGCGDVDEVILSGGDPLSVSDTGLAELMTSLEAIAYLERLRIHSRLPVVLPSRIGDGLTDRLETSRLRTVVVLHANHANELDEAVAGANARLAGAGSVVLNQAVLLAGVNDSADAQVELAERLFEIGVLPYYLHMLDPVTGAAGFDVDERRARRIYGEMLARLPGYLVPRLVREVPGAVSKTPISPLMPDA